MSGLYLENQLRLQVANEKVINRKLAKHHSSVCNRLRQQSVLAWGKYHTVVRENNALRKRNQRLEKEVLEIVS